MGVAVKDTLVPAHIGFMEAEMVTPTGRFELATMIILLDVAGLLQMHALFEVSLQLTVSPGFGGYINTESFVPWFTLLTFH